MRFFGVLCKDFGDDYTMSRAIIQSDLSIRVADSFLSRLIGWIGKKKIEPNEALIIIPCNRIHTIGMNASIDAIFVGADNLPIHVIPNLAPGKMPPAVKGAKYVIEMKAGSSNLYGISVGRPLPAAIIQTISP